MNKHYAIRRAARVICAQAYGVEECSCRETGHHCESMDRAVFEVAREFGIESGQLYGLLDGSLRITNTPRKRSKGAAA